MAKPITAATTTAWTEERQGRDLQLLSVSERFPAAAGEELAGRIIQLAEQGTRAFVVDLSEVGVLDPRAVLPLVREARRLGARGVPISVVFDPLLLVFQVPGVDAFYDVAVTAEDAITRLPASAR